MQLHPRRQKIKKSQLWPSGLRHMSCVAVLTYQRGFEFTLSLQSLFFHPAQRSEIYTKRCEYGLYVQLSFFSSSFRRPSQGKQFSFQYTSFDSTASFISSGTELLFLRELHVVRACRIVAAHKNHLLLSKMYSITKRIHFFLLALGFPTYQSRTR